MPKLTHATNLARPTGANRYARHADAYIEAGWTTTAVHGKQSPYKRTTGYHGEVTPEIDAAMRRSDWHDNIAIRHDDDTLSIDVDEGGGKRGAATLATLAEALGDLPATFSSTARGQDDPRRQHFYRKPADALLLTTLTPGLVIAGVTMETGDIELPQRRHRYSVVWPSVHPDTGETYRWYDLDGEPMDGPPRVEDLPMLPDAWVAALAEGAVTTAGGGTSRGRQTLDQLLADPPARGTGRMNDWLKLVAGHYAARHRNDQATYERLTREAAAKVDPDYEDTETVIASIWKTDTRNHPDRTPARVTVTVSGEGRVSLDDSLLAEFVAAKLDGEYCWASGLGWLHYDGRRWREVSDATLVEATRRILKDQYHYEIEVETDRKRMAQFASLLAAGKIRSVVGLVRGIVERDPADFDRHPDLLNVANGVVDLRTSELLPHDPSHLFTKITDVPYARGARSADWDKALAALPSDVADWMQVRFGQGVTGYPTSDDLLPILQGGGANGKSTVIDSVTGALGEHSVIVPEKLLTASSHDHPTELTTLMGARLAIIEELPEGARFSVKRLKDVLGTAKITARKIQRDNVTWKATHSLFVTTNYRPRVDETDHGTWRRLSLVRFPFTFKRGAVADERTRPGDPALRERMRVGGNGQHEAVLAWVIDGARRWYEAGKQFPPMPTKVVEDTLEWRTDTDLVLAYVGDNLRFDPTASVLATELFEHFNAWLKARGQAEWGDTTMTRRFGEHTHVTDHGVQKRRSRALESVSRPPGKSGGAGVKQANIWVGIAFREDADERPDDLFEGGF